MTPYWEVYLAREVSEQGHPFSPRTLTFQARYAFSLIPCSPCRLTLSCKTSFDYYIVPLIVPQMPEDVVELETPNSTQETAVHLAEKCLEFIETYCRGSRAPLDKAAVIRDITTLTSESP